MDDKVDKRQASKLRVLEKTRQMRRDDFVKAALGTQQGQEYLYWVLGLCGIDRNPFTSNALTTSFACGALNVGQQIRGHIEEVAPDLFLRMLVAHKEENDNAIRDPDTGSTATGSYADDTDDGA